MTQIMSASRTTLVGVLLVTLGPLSLSLYTPALPILVDAFHTTPGMVNMTLTVYFCGFALSQLASGPLSDAYGRRSVALGFLVAYGAGSIVAALAPNIEWLLAGRAMQGIGVASGVVIARAIVRDQFTGQASAQILNLMGLMLAIVPSLAPSTGGILLHIFGWHAIFVVMAGFALVILVLFAIGVPETNHSRDPEHANPRIVLRNYRILIVNGHFMGAALVVGLILGGLYTLSALLSYVLMKQVGLSPTEFGFAMLFQTGGYTLGAIITGRLLRRIKAMRLIPLGLFFVLIAAVGYGVGLRLLPPSLLSIMIPTAFWSFGLAFIMPGATTDALADFPTMAGSASALMGFMHIGGGFIGTAIAAIVFADPLTALRSLMPAIAILAAFTPLLGRGRKSGSISGAASE